MKLKLLGGLLLLALFIAGCSSDPSSLIKTEQPAYDAFITLADQGSLGQTFMARYDGLQGILLYLQPDTGGNGTLRLHLRANPDEPTDLRAASLPLDEVTAPGFYSLNFAPIEESTGQDYYLVIQVRGPGSLQVGKAAGSTYLNGAAYQDHQPLDAQLAFQLGYSSRYTLTGLVSEGLRWSLLLAVGVFLFILPGWALSGLLWQAWPGLPWPELLWAEKLGISIGVSLAIYPLLILWTSLIGLQLGKLYAWLPPLIGLAVLVLRNRQRLGNLPKSLGGLPSSVRKSLGHIHWANLALLITFALIFASRFWVIRSIDVPMWGDSYQHTVMAQLLSDNNGMFSSWQPYAELQTFTYHFGFHSLAAVFAWMTGMGIPQAVLWTGQILNGLAVITLYPLAMRISRNPWGGTFAVLLAGLLIPMPMYYTNWGRYTQLAGQAILPAVVYLAWVVLEKRQTGPNPASSKPIQYLPNDWRLHGLLWIAFGGLALTHYRVLVFAILFLGAFFFLHLQIKNGLFKSMAQMMVDIFWVGVGAALLFLPWFIQVFTGQIMLTVGAQIKTPPGQGASFTEQYNAIGNLFTYLPALVWVALTLAIAWGLWRREKGAALISLWWYFILLAANPQWFKLPGAGAITNFAVFIAAYIPASLLIGNAFGWLTEYKKEPIPDPQHATIKEQTTIDRHPGSTWMALFLVLALFVVGFWGTRQRVNDIKTAPHALATRPDIRAAEWLLTNTPSEANFLVNSFFAYGGSAIVGSDGGWWLPILASRQTSLPPLTYTSEQGPFPNYPLWVNALTAEIQAKGIDHPDVLDELKERGITHVYIGQRQGQINAPMPLLQVTELLESPSYAPVFHEDRVWVFEVIQNEGKR